MKIRIAALKTGHNTLGEFISPLDLGLDPQTIQSPIEVNYEVEKSSGRLLVKVKTKAVGVYICDRCGEEFSRLISGECDVAFIQRDTPFPGESLGDDLRTYRIGQEELDVSSEIRDALLLEIPMKALCRDDCLGLCAGCGANLNLESCRCSSAGAM